MPLSVAFWVVFVIWVLFGAYHRLPGYTVAPISWGGDLLLVILVAMLGWHDFGAIITGR